MKRIAIAAAAALLMIGSAQAQQARAASPWYGELGYSFQRIDVDGVGHVSPQALRGIVGYNIHPYFGLEGMLQLGTSSDSGLKVDNAFGLFVKPKYDINNFEVFGRLGWVRSKLKASGNGVTASDSDNDFAYGLGVNYNINPRTYAGIDYLRQYDKDGLKIDGWTINVGYRF